MTYIDNEISSNKIILDPNKVVLVGVCLQGEDIVEKEKSLDELELLAKTAGLVAVEKMIQKRSKINASTYVGSGFIEEIEYKAMINGAQQVIFDNELSPTQGKNISEALKIDVIDRTEVILNIFHKHAQTHEARLQVKLAELQYQLPRLKKLWSHLEGEKASSSGASKGTSTGSRGMGETQLEVDKRLIRNDISKVQRKLHDIVKQKETQSKQRSNLKRICLVGYTNAGKSTLFNNITNAGVLAEDKLFATLDSTVRMVKLKRGREMVISDTVGFISQLPHHLVASFRATLKEVTEADLLLHVIDASDERFDFYIDEVNHVLESIGASEVKTQLVFNKIDRLEKSQILFLQNRFPGAIFVSAKQGINVKELKDKIENKLHYSATYRLFIPFTEQKSASKLEVIGEIVNKDYQNQGTEFVAIINDEDVRFFRRFLRFTIDDFYPNI
jgi:GTP-binding protein HflX